MGWKMRATHWTYRGADMKCVEFSTLEQAIQYLCAAALGALKDALQQKGQAHLVVSGGQSPRLYLPQLAESLSDWKNVCVSLSDERWVLPSDYESNEGMVRKYFVERAQGVHFVGMMGVCMDVQEDARAASRAYDKLQLPADISLLGVGPDGHIASLFPGFDNDAMAPSILVTSQPSSGQTRLSMSPQRLLMTRKIIVLAKGDDKHRVVAEAMEEGSFEQLPLRLLLHQDSVPVEVLQC